MTRLAGWTADQRAWRTQACSKQELANLCWRATLRAPLGRACPCTATLTLQLLPQLLRWDISINATLLLLVLLLQQGLRALTHSRQAQ